MIRREGTVELRRRLVGAGALGEPLDLIDQDEVLVWGGQQELESRGPIPRR